MTHVTPALRVVEVAWDDPDAVALRDAMDAEVMPRYADRLATTPPPPEMAVDPADLVFTGVAYDHDRAVGHVAVRRLGSGFELKRMYVDPTVRGRGVGQRLIAAAEDAAVAAGGTRLVLQTGDRQPDAVATYTKARYARIPIFAPYLGLPFSHCFGKDLIAARRR